MVYPHAWQPPPPSRQFDAVLRGPAFVVPPRIPFSPTHHIAWTMSTGSHAEETVMGMRDPRKPERWEMWTADEWATKACAGWAYAPDADAWWLFGWPARDQHPTMERLSCAST